MKKLDLGKDSINQLLLSFAIPCVISMLINSIYNIVDQILLEKVLVQLEMQPQMLFFHLCLFLELLHL